MEINKFQIIRKIAKINLLRKIAINYYGIFAKSDHKLNDKTVFSELEIDRSLQEINEKGYSLGIQLSSDLLTEILDFCEINEVCINRNKDNKTLISMVDETPPAIGTVFSYTNTYKNCEAVRNIAHDPKIYEIVKNYLGCPPKFVGSQIWWSYPQLNEKGEKIKTHLYGYHYDIDDLKFLKIFFYLNDVDEDRGPHVIIGNTHKKKNYFEIRNRRLTDEVANDKYAKQIKVITGKAGSGFFEDTFCYHKGTHPNKRRLLLQFEFAINDFGHQNDDN
ncbi:MAG: hypothetical protein COA97_12100 [Flavobacteriales bacterium]|nr:MAG: hypothetical protein COA97_12100 [Flavobacteriales bacterium]